MVRGEDGFVFFFFSRVQRKKHNSPCNQVQCGLAISSLPETEIEMSFKWMYNFY